MASLRKITANRRNTQYSTEPLTPNGKGRSKHNALRHGLAVRLPATGTVDRDVERLASAIAGPDPDPCCGHFAKIAAEAELELRRVHAIRLSLLAPRAPAGSAGPEPDHETHATTAALLVGPRLDRYERRALSRRNRALRLL
jgi:hypothetical protein